MLRAGCGLSKLLGGCSAAFRIALGKRLWSDNLVPCGSASYSQSPKKFYQAFWAVEKLQIQPFQPQTFNPLPICFQNALKVRTSIVCQSSSASACTTRTVEAVKRMSAVEIPAKQRNSRNYGEQGKSGFENTGHSKILSNDWRRLTNHLV